MTEINFECKRKEFEQRIADRRAKQHQQLFEAFISSVQRDLYPRQRRSLVQIATLTMVRWAAWQLNQWLERLSNEENDDSADAMFVDTVYTVVEPEPPIAASFFQRKGTPYGSTHAQKGQERPRSPDARTYTPDGRYRDHCSSDDGDDARNERVSSGDGGTGSRDIALD